MQHINACGKRGLGDLVAGISYILKTIDKDTHITFYFPIGHNYPERIKSLMNSFVLPSYKITYEVDESWSTVDVKKARQRFNSDEENKSWFFFPCDNKETYQPFKSQWLKNTRGPIAMALNNEMADSKYPIPGRLFSSQVNRILTDLIDNEKYFSLDRSRSIEENIEIMSKCRYVIGVNGGWTHIADSMRVPFILSRNDHDIGMIKSMFRYHPTLTVIEQYDIFKYV